MEVVESPIPIVEEAVVEEAAEPTPIRVNQHWFQLTVTDARQIANACKNANYQGFTVHTILPVMSPLNPNGPLYTVLGYRAMSDAEVAKEAAEVANAQAAESALKL